MDCRESCELLDSQVPPKHVQELAVARTPSIKLTCIQTALGYEVSASWTPLDTGIPRIVILPFYYGGPRPVGAHCRYVFIDDLKSFFEAKKHLL